MKQVLRFGYVIALVLFATLASFASPLTDTNDGIITVTMSDTTHVGWQAETNFPAQYWNLYSGDVGVLKATRVYTQGLLNCDVGSSPYPIVDNPAPGHANFYIVTATAPNADNLERESSLGNQSNGILRQKAISCDTQNENFTMRYWNMPGTNSSPAMPTGPADLVYFFRYPNVTYDGWGQGSPRPGVINPDHFGGWYSATVFFPEEGDYLFEWWVDDGGVAWLDDQQILAAWQDHPMTHFTAIVHVSWGYHSYRIGYYDNTGEAYLVTRWTRLP